MASSARLSHAHVRQSLVPRFYFITSSLLVADVAAVFLRGEIFHDRRFVLGVFEPRWLPEHGSELLCGQLSVTNTLVLIDLQVFFEKFVIL